VRVLGVEVQGNRFAQVGDRFVDRLSLCDDRDLETFGDEVIAVPRDDGVHHVASKWARIDRDGTRGAVPAGRPRTAGTT
jgi:hypothetical protein